MQNSIFETLPLEEDFDFPFAVGRGMYTPAIEINPTKMRKKNPALIAKELNKNYREDGTSRESAGAGFRGFTPTWSVITEFAQDSGWVAHATLATDLESIAFIADKAVARCAYRLTLDVFGNDEDVENDQPFHSGIDVTLNIKNFYVDPAQSCFEDLKFCLAEHIRINVAQAISPLAKVLPTTVGLTLSTTYSDSNQLLSGIVQIVSELLAGELGEEILDRTEMGKSHSVFVFGSSWGSEAKKEIQGSAEDESDPMSMAA